MSDASFLCYGDQVTHFWYWKTVADVTVLTNVITAVAACSIAGCAFAWARGRKRLWIMALVALCFAYIAGANVVAWGTNQSQIVLYLWLLQIVAEFFVYVGMLVLVLSIMSLARHVRWAVRGAAVFYTMIAGLLVSGIMAPGFNVVDCIPIFSVFSMIMFAVQVVCLLIVFFVVVRYWLIDSFVGHHMHRDRIVCGMMGFLALGTIFGMNVIGIATGQWDLVQYGYYVFLMWISVFAYQLYLLERT